MLKQARIKIMKFKLSSTSMHGLLLTLTNSSLENERNLPNEVPRRHTTFWVGDPPIFLGRLERDDGWKTLTHPRKVLWQRTTSDRVDPVGSIMCTTYSCSRSIGETSGPAHLVLARLQISLYVCAYFKTLFMNLILFEDDTVHASICYVAQRNTVYVCCVARGWKIDGYY